MADFGTGKVITARKPRLCEWCGEAIKKGDKEYHFKGMWQGQWQDWKMHPECQEAYANDDGFDEGFESYANERPTPSK